MKKKTYKNKQAGFTLLFASLVVTLILSIAIAIANITLSQLILSSAGRESQAAFYNADTGVECALFYEDQTRADGVSPFFSTSNVPPDQDIVCDGKIATGIVMESSGSGATARATTTFAINASGGGCIKSDPTYIVKVARSVRNAFATNVYIESRGYNTCDTTNPRRVERGLYVKMVD